MFWKTRQQRIGVFTRDWRKIESALVRLDSYEARLLDLKTHPFSMDNWELTKLVKAWADAYAFQLAAQYDRGADIKQLESKAHLLEENMQKSEIKADDLDSLLSRALMIAESTALRNAATWWSGAANP